MFVTASQLTRVELNAARTISASSIRVNSILACNATAGALEVRFTDTAGTEILSIALPANSSFLWTGPAIFSSGLLALSNSDANVSVTVAHSAAGA